jgi:hypothetical protein
MSSPIGRTQQGIVRVVTQINRCLHLYMEIVLQLTMKTGLIIEKPAKWGLEPFPSRTSVGLQNTWRRRLHLLLLAHRTKLQLTTNQQLLRGTNMSFPSNKYENDFIPSRVQNDHPSYLFRRYLVVLLLFAMTSLTVLHGQEFRGTLRGQITDPTGAVVSDAAIMHMVLSAS